MRSIKKYYYIAMILFAGLLSSCDLDINVNPDEPTTTTVEEVLPVVLFYGAQLNYDHAEYGTYLSQTLTTGGRSQTGSLAYKSGWEFLTMNRHPQWRRHYYDIGVNARELIRLAQATNANNYELIGRTLVLMSTLYTTDAFGAMPLSDAYTSVTPKYDSQEQVYTYLYSEIDKLISDYENDDYVNASSNKKITSRNDRIFAGDMQKWKAFAYGLKARIYLRKLPNMDTSQTTCKTIIDAVNAALTNWEEPLYRYDGGVNEQNCPWGPQQPTVNSWESRPNDLDEAIVSTYFAEQILCINETSAAKQDPRCEKIMKRRSGPTSDPNVKYRYLDANFGMDAAYSAKHYPDLYNREDGLEMVLTSNTGYVPYMLTEELLMIKAEAQYWNGDVAGAYNTTKEAATINMNRHGVSASRQRYYFQSTFFMPESSFDLGHLMRQKYICMFLQADQWTDMRRYKYSNGQNDAKYFGISIYPGLKRPYNLYDPYWNQTDEDKTKWVQRLNYDPETEEKYNRKQLEELGAFRDYEWLRKPMIWAE